MVSECSDWTGIEHIWKTYRLFCMHRYEMVTKEVGLEFVGFCCLQIYEGCCEAGIDWACSTFMWKMHRNIGSEFSVRCPL
jgi:hypothetical protein